MNVVNDNAAVVTRTATTKQHLDATPPSPVLISEHEVVFGTAAAMPMRPNAIHWWSEVSSVALAAMRRLSLKPASNNRQPRRHYPKRYGFLERSCMGREMQRL